MSCVFQNIDPPPPSPPGECTPRLCCGGRTHSPGGEEGGGGVGGQYFGRRKTQLFTLPISNPLCSTLYMQHNIQNLLSILLFLKETTQEFCKHNLNLSRQSCSHKKSDYSHFLHLARHLAKPAQYTYNTVKKV
jgi:hypothetical protein